MKEGIEDTKSAIAHGRFHRSVGAGLVGKAGQSNMCPGVCSYVEHSRQRSLGVCRPYSGKIAVLSKNPSGAGMEQFDAVRAAPLPKGSRRGKETMYSDWSFVIDGSFRGPCVEGADGDCVGVVENVIISKIGFERLLKPRLMRLSEIWGQGSRNLRERRDGPAWGTRPVLGTQAGQCGL